MEDPWTNRIGAFALPGSAAHLFHRKSLTSPLLVQCSAPASRWVVSFMERSFFGMVAVSRSDARPNRDGVIGALYNRHHDGNASVLPNPACKFVAEGSPQAGPSSPFRPRGGGKGGAGDQSALTARRLTR